jgi:elongation factor P
VQSPSSRSGSTLYKVRGHDILTRQKVEARYKGDENVQTVEFSRRPVLFLYRDVDGCTFMDKENYEQYTLAAEALEDELKYLSDNLDGILAMISDDTVLGIELPATVTLEIHDTAPGMRTASSSARTKPATLSTGLVVQVPEYLAPGETIKVNTGTGEYVSRA